MSKIFAEKRMEGSGSRLATAGEDLKIWASPSFSLKHQVGFYKTPCTELVQNQFTPSEHFQIQLTASELFPDSVHTLLLITRLLKLLEPGHNLRGKCP